MFEDFHRSPGQSNAQYERGVIQFVADHQASRRQKCWYVEGVRCEAHAKRDGILHAQKFSCEALQLFVEGIRAVLLPSGSRRYAILVQSFYGRFCAWT